MAYIGIGVNNGKRIEKEEAFDYALEQIQNNEEEKADFIAWFYSGSWYKEDNNEL